MKIVLVSDLHIDFKGQLQIEDITWPEAEVIIVAGDTSNSGKRTAKELNKLANIYPIVIAVDGNHCHYSNNYHNPKISSIENNIKYIKSSLQENVKFLNCETFDLGCYRFIGCMGWYSMDYDRPWEQNIEFWAKYMNDHKYIYERGDRKQPLPANLAAVHAAYLSNAISEALEAGKKPIVVTHTIPHQDCLWHKVWDPQWERAHAFYLNRHNEELLKYRKDDIHYWFFGHTHARLHKVVGQCNLMSNPRGYPGENPSWEPLILDI